jgi:hypothetical protein
MGCGIRDIEPKARTEIGNTFCPDISLMALENALYDSQADAAAGQVWGMVQALEDPEELMVGRHVEPNTIVIEIEDGLGIAFVPSKTYFGRSLRPAEFPGVLEQLFERKGQQEGITKGREVRRNGYFYVFFGMEASEFRDHTLRDVAQVDDGFVHDVAGDARELKQAVEQTTHVVGCLDDALKIGGGLFVELLAEGIKDDF